MSDAAPPSKTGQIQNALSGIIGKDDRFVVQMVNDKIEVRPISDKDSLKAFNPDLHGKLLRYEQKFIGTGHEFWFYILGAMVANVVISQNLLLRFGVDLKDVQSWWVYVGVVVVAFILNNHRINARSKAQYDKHATSIKEDITNAGLTVDQVVSMTSKDGAVFNVRQRLMMD